MLTGFAIVRFRATVRFLGSFSYLFISLILGLIAMGFSWVYLPDQFVQLQRSASVVRDWIASRWSTRTESILRFLLDDNKLLLISFVLGVRLALELFLVLPIKALFNWAKRRIAPA